MSEADIPTVASPPTFADQVAAIDATEVAARIAASGARAAMGASTIEIVAMAKRFLALLTIADLTYELLVTADQLPAATPTARDALKAEVAQQISVLGASLEALGYGQQPTEEEKTDGQG